MSQLASGSNQEVLSPGTTAAEHVVILGGGFGGWYAARHLAGILPLEHKITLVDRVDHMLYTPMLTEGCRGPSSSADHCRAHRADVAACAFCAGGDPVGRCGDELG